ncbi:DUF805 domain-containing protein [Listeria monocytogenes]|uniref:DUF805 domain-containing protein n=1 Tax=Listeria monocytogenes TaxID=1639 RepID=UPI0001EB8895|nr:DUF805 domain-containing protein [Listeria monocytogenes]EFR85477.1 inner membrane protein YhaI [Listeria monocytogenes FSL F2-208]EAD7633192.1 DUF805 domain-containing protein [Listeria monocytogenes]EAF0571587.1 DUF805 domain-containing protein [Listeria monocytogenes]EAG9490252.1 DUF805 domain-containing protein [Listeria monocytogenes]EBI2479515.1 DUF805 domain-containing protein [Listeria monocytogenes]
MGFLEAYKLFWKNYFNFKGRTSRSAYWCAELINLLIIGLLYLALFKKDVPADVGNDVDTTPLFGGLPPVVMVILLIYIFATFIPRLAMVARRLQDTGKPGSLMCVGFLPVVGPFILFILLVIESNGPNQYGEFPDEPKKEK